MLRLRGKGEGWVLREAIVHMWRVEIEQVFLQRRNGEGEWGI